MSNKKQKVHIVGIAGKGMSGLAIMLKNAGWVVTGSDVGSFGAPVSALKKAGIDFAETHVAQNIPLDADLIIIGKHAKLTLENPEVKAAFDSGIPIQSMAQVIGELAEKHKNQIVVVGSYAKSTCTSLLAWCMRESNLDPSYFIGASPKGFETTAHLGRENYFVAEGDEYPSSNFDATSKFLYLHPNALLITSAEHDHVTVFPTISSYLKPYQTLLQKMSSDNMIVACTENPNVTELLTNTQAQVIAYGVNVISGWHAKNITKKGSATCFELWNQEEKIGDLETTLIGEYNIQNIIGASALLISYNILDISEIVSAIKSFQGVIGRLDIKNQGGTIPVYESYGSSYTKAKSSIEALQKHYPDKKLHIIFEPHTFTWRDPSQSKAYENVFDGAASVILYETPSSHGKNIEGQLSLADIQSLVAQGNIHADIAREPTEALELLRKKLGTDAVVLIITSGDIGGLTKSVPVLVEKEF